MTAERLAGLPAAARLREIARLGEEEAGELLGIWPFWARAGQLPPPGDWRVWLMMAGRGFGKTRAGAEWVRGIAEADGAARIALVAATLGGADRAGAAAARTGRQARHGRAGARMSAPAPAAHRALRFAGYAALFDRVDQGGDVIRRGAFARAAAAGPAGVPLLWQHDPGRPIGRIETLAEDARGLRVIARLTPDARHAGDARRVAVAYRAGLAADWPGL